MQFEKRKRRSVSFVDRVIVYEYIRRDELSVDERSQSWYCGSELHQIHQENNETVRRMMAGTCHKQWCSRGLESRTPTGARLRYKHRRDAMDAVLEYQSLETESGIERNDDKISKVYADHTEHCTRVAILMATIDAQAIEGDAQMPTRCSPSTPNRPIHGLNTSGSPSPIFIRAA